MGSKNWMFRTIKIKDNIVIMYTTILNMSISLIPKIKETNVFVGDSTKKLVDVTLLTFIWLISENSLSIVSIKVIW